MTKIDSTQKYRTIKSKEGRTGELDNRPRYWCRIPMKKLMDPLISLRKEKQTLLKKGIDIEKITQLNKQ